MSRKTVEVVGSAGRIVILESELKRYQSRGYRLVESVDQPTPAKELKQRKSTATKMIMENEV